MKKTGSIPRIILLSFFLLVVTVHVTAQKVTLSYKNVPLEKVLNSIKQQTGLALVFSEQLVDVNRKVSINATSVEVGDVLKQLLAETNVDFEINNNKLYLVERQVVKSQISPNQSKKITGLVTDEKGEPIIGASVVLKGSNTGTITNIDGTFSLEVQDQSEIIISYIGYKQTDLKVGKANSYKIILEEASKSLDEVVVVGYGTQKKINMTGSVASINFTDQAVSRPITNISSALAGLFSGVSVRQSSGRPGSDGGMINIRGVGTLNDATPLIIVDGIESSMDAVNPHDVESISVLKDAASASIYGARGANGVILITTKFGSADKTTVTYTGRASIAQPTNIIDLVSDYAQYMELMNESYQNLGSSPIFGQSTIDAWKSAQSSPNGLTTNGTPNYIAYPNTNWAKEMFQNNIIKEHNISVDGGNEKTKYSLSAGYLDNPGLVEYTGIERFTTRLNLSTKINKWLTVGTRTYGYMQNQEPGDFSSANLALMQTTPGIYPRYNGNYGYPEASEESATAGNIYTALLGTAGNNKTTRFNTTLFSKVDILKGLSWDFNLSYARLWEENTYRTNTYQQEKFSTGEIMKTKVPLVQQVTGFSNAGNETYDLENILRYHTTFDKNHNVSTLAGYSERYYNRYSISGSKKGLVDESIYVLSTASNAENKLTGNIVDNSLRSFFGRINYDYKSLYLFEANLRYDGSSRFHSDSRWGLFPAFSAGWRISEEGFLKNLNLDMQNLKIRASWGQLGNNSVDNYVYASTYGVTNYSFGGTQYLGLAQLKFGNSLLHWETTTVSNIGLDASFFNNRLSGEIDIYKKFTDGILYELPIYPVMGTTAAPVQNVAEVTNTGIEFSMKWNDKIGNLNYSVKGTFGFNKNIVSKFKGELTRGWVTDESGNKVYQTNLGDVSSGTTTRILEGHPINEFYLLRLHKGNGQDFLSDGSVNPQGGPKDGMIRTEADLQWAQAMVNANYTLEPLRTVAKNTIWYGDFVYADINGDRIYGGTDDYDFTGTNATPKYNFGLDIATSWKGFDFSMLWAGSAGFDLYMNEAWYGYNRSNTRYGSAISTMIADDHYFYNDEANPNIATPNNISATFPRLRNYNNGEDGQNAVPSTFYLYKGDYLKLKNLTFGYTLDKSTLKKLPVSSIRIYFSGENLLTLTAFPGLDPEQGGGIPGYTSIKQFSFGTNITF